VTARQGVQIGFAAAGLAVGAYLGNPQLGLAIGTVLGAVVANVAFPLDDIINKQDNLADVPITSAAIGQMKPIVYGVWPLGGNIIWTYPKIAIEHSETVDGGGKGGFGGPKTVNVTTTYRWHGMIALCEGPISRITRIYTDATLIYDEAQPEGWTVSRGLPNGEPDSPEESVTLPDTIIYEKANADSLTKFTLFRGTATQEPWAFAESLEDVGEGLLPAYRHTVVVGVTMDLGVTGRVPNLRFEVSTTDEALGVPFAVHWLPEEKALWSVWKQSVADVSGDGFAIRYDATSFMRERFVSLRPSLESLPRGTRAPVATTVGQTLAGQDAVMVLRQDSSMAVFVGSTGNVIHRRINPLTTEEEEELGTLGLDGDLAVRPNLQDGNRTTLLYTLSDVPALGQVETHTGTETYTFQRLTLAGTPHAVVWNEEETSAYVSIPDEGMVQRITGYSPLTVAEAIACGEEPTTLFVASTGQCWVTARGSAEVFRFTTSGDLSAAIAVGVAPHDLTEASDGFIWVANTGEPTVCRINPTSLAVQTFTLPAAPVRVMGALEDGACWVISHAGRWAALVNDDGTYALMALPRGPSDLTVDEFGNCWVVCETARTLVKVNTEATEILQAENANALACVVRDVNLRAGMPEEWIDVSGLDGTPVHYALFGVAAASRALEDLAMAFQFLAVETATGIKYLFKGGAPVATIHESATLVAAQNEGTLAIERAQPQELPTSVNVVYRSPLRHYHTDEQTKTKPTDGPTIPVIQQIAPAFDDAQYAKDLAEILLYEPVFARYAAKLQAPPMAARLEPGDLLTIHTAAGQTYDVRLLKSALGTDNRVEWDTIRHRSYLYEGFQSLPAEGDPGEVIIPQLAPIEVHIVEPVPLPDETESTHLLFALTKKATTLQNEPLPLVTVYESTDNEATYSPVKVLARQATVGTIATALPNGATHTWDRSIMVEVVLRPGSPALTAATEAAPHYAMIGEECIAFTTPTLVGERTYNLSVILRGAQGSEQHCRTHQANETFVLLESIVRATKRLFSPALLGTTHHYKAVPEGINISAVTGQAHVLLGTSSKAWAPVLLSVEKDGDDWEITWLHRSRIRGAWVDLAGIAYDTDDLRTYTITFYTSRAYTTVQATYTTAVYSDPEATRTFTYTLAQQTADFGAEQEVIYIGIRSGTTNQQGYETRYPTAAFDAWEADWEADTGLANPGWEADWEYYTWPPSSGNAQEAWNADWENEP
jgi:hypothetical protein